MGKIIWSEESDWWLKDIHDYIGLDSITAAQRTVAGIRKSAQILKEFPEAGYIYSGHEGPEKIRIILYGHYRIAYQFRETGEVYILGVFHGALDIKRHLRIERRDKKE